MTSEQSSEVRQREVTAYMSVVVVATWIGCVSWAGLMLWYVITDQSFDVSTYAVTFVATVPVIVMGSGVILIINRVRVGPQGLVGSNFWGLRAKVSWDDAQMLRPISVLGLSFLLVGKPGVMSRLWFPLFVLRPNVLLDALVRFAGPDHKLVIAFRNAI